MSTPAGRNYGWIGHGHPAGRVSVPRGQAMSGFPVGIIVLGDAQVPFVPGNVMNAWTYDFPVRYREVETLTSKQLFDADDSVLDALIATGRKLELDGVRAISAGCGFFGNYQAELVEALNVPVAVSSLVQVPWMQTILGLSAKLGVLTANGPAVTDRLLTACGITHPENLVIEDLGSGPEFSGIITDRGHFDDSVIRAEVVAGAQRIVGKEPDVRAILLECTELPPYACDVQAAVGLPVFDFITLIRWLRFAVQQSPYQGFM